MAWDKGKEQNTVSPGIESTDINGCLKLEHARDLKRYSWGLGLQPSMHPEDQDQSRTFNFSMGAGLEPPTRPEVQDQSLEPSTFPWNQNQNLPLVQRYRTRTSHLSRELGLEPPTCPEDQKTSLKPSTFHGISLLGLQPPTHPCDQDINITLIQRTC